MAIPGGRLFFITSINQFFVLKKIIILKGFLVPAYNDSY